MDRIKYPRTMNVAWSKSESSDDVWLKSDDIFRGKEVVISEKLDGECTTLYPDGYMHARSRDYSAHPSRHWIKGLQAQLTIPEGYRWCGENLFAFHSIFYTDLPSYFFVFGIYDENNFCIPWDQVEAICELEQVPTVPVFYKGLWEDRPTHEELRKSTYPTYAATVEDNFVFPDTFKECDSEGYVIRLADGFPYEDFAVSCGKYVSGGFKSAMRDSHWLTANVFPNLLAD